MPRAITRISSPLTQKRRKQLIRRLLVETNLDLHEFTDIFRLLGHPADHGTIENNLQNALEGIGRITDEDFALALMAARACHAAEPHINALTDDLWDVVDRWHFKFGSFDIFVEEKDTGFWPTVGLEGGDLDQRAGCHVGTMSKAKLKAIIEIMTYEDRLREQVLMRR